jgi:hypothetical protein
VALDYSNSPPWLRDWIESRFYTEPAPEPMPSTDQSMVLGQTPPIKRRGVYGDSELDAADLSPGSGSLADLGASISSKVQDLIEGAKGLFTALGPDKDDAKENAAAGKGVSLQAPGETYQLPGGQVSYYQNSNGEWTAVNNITNSIMPGVSPPSWVSPEFAPMALDPNEYNLATPVSDYVHTGLEPSDSLFGRIGDWVSDLDPFSLDKGEVDIDLPFSSFFEGHGLPTTGVPPGMQGVMDSTLPTMDRVGAGAHALLGTIAGMVVPGAGLLGLGASIMNSAGAYHEYNPSLDSSLSFNPSAGRISWDSLSPGGGGHQYGAKSNYNMMRNADPNQTVAITDTEGNIVGYSKAGNIAEYQANVQTHRQLGEDSMSIFGMHDSLDIDGPFTGREFGDEDFDFSGTTNRDAMNEYDALGIGSIRNEAGAIARERFGKFAGKSNVDRIADQLRERMGQKARDEETLEWELDMRDDDWDYDVSVDTYDIDVSDEDSESWSYGYDAGWL